MGMIHDNKSACLVQKIKMNKENNEDSIKLAGHRGLPGQLQGQS